MSNERVGELKTHTSRKLSSANEGGAQKIRGLPKVGTMQVIAGACRLMVKCQFGIVSRNAMRSHKRAEHERSAHNWRHN